MEEATELGNYVPLSYKTLKEHEYIESLWDAFETNYIHSNYRSQKDVEICVGYDVVSLSEEKEHARICHMHDALKSGDYGCDL